MSGQRTAARGRTGEIALAGLMVAVIEVCKFAIGWIPNVELTSFWLILFTRAFGKRVWPAVPVFILLEGVVYGFGIWWVMYLYAWPLLVLAVLLMRRQEGSLVWAILSGAFGLLFGALCAIPYFFLGLVDGGVGGGLRMMVGWWIAGIPWDIVHGTANFLLMLLLYRPMQRALSAVPPLFAAKPNAL